MFKNIFGNQKKEENIIILTLRELGINIIELLAREQLYRQKKLPREISDIIESNLVINKRLVNALKRNIFTEKELSEELREKILELVKWLRILFLAEQKAGNQVHKINFNNTRHLYLKENDIKNIIHSDIPKELKNRRREFYESALFLKNVGFYRVNSTIRISFNEAQKLSEELTLELEAKERAENIQKLEKKELEAVRKELNKLSQSLTTKEKTINNEISKNVALRAQKAENGEKINQLEKEKNEWKEKVRKLEKELRGEIRKKNWALFASSIQGLTKELMGDKWGERANQTIQFTTGISFFRNAGEWTYEVWLIGIGVGLVFVVPRLYNIGADMLEKWAGVKLPRWNAKDKISQELDKLNEKAKEKAINVIVNLQQPTNEVNTEKKELNQPAAISKEEVKQEEIVPQISNDTIPKENESKRKKKKKTVKGK